MLFNVTIQRSAEKDMGYELDLDDTGADAIHSKLNYVMLSTKEAAELKLSISKAIEETRDMQMKRKWGGQRGN